MSMPNFLIIGAMKSGTTSLWYYLKQHPQIYMSPIKEPQFFCYEGQRLDFRGPGDEGLNRDSITDLETYQSHFDGASTAAVIGDASTLYLYEPRAAARIHYYIPNAKLIAILRNPADRAYSAFRYRRRERFEPIADFEEALKAEPMRIRNNWAPHWHYQRAGFYFEQVKRYFDLFDRDQIRIYLYDEMKAEPLGFLRNIFRFLNVDDTFAPDISVRYNTAGIPRSKVFQSLLIGQHPFKVAVRLFVPKHQRRRIFAKLYHRNLMLPPPLPPEVREQLIELYRLDILKLQELIQRDLSKWLETPPSTHRHVENTDGHRAG